MTKKEILNTLADNTHTLWAKSFVDDVNTAFGTKLECINYSAGLEPKGLTLHNGGDQEIGLSSFHLAPRLCDALGVEYETFMGRGFQVRACVAALREAGHGGEE